MFRWSDDIDDLQATEKTILESLPTRKQAIIAVATAKVGHDDHDGDNLEYLSNDQWSFYKLPKVSQVFLSFLSFNLFWRFLVTLRSMRCIWTTSPAPTLGRRKQGRCMQSSREDLTRLFQYYQRTVFAVFFRQVEKGIEERNAKLVEEGKIPYTVLLPRKIPTGIAVWFFEEFFRPCFGWWTNQHDLMHCPIISLPIWSDCCLLCRSNVRRFIAHYYPHQLSFCLIWSLIGWSLRFC